MRTSMVRGIPRRSTLVILVLLSALVAGTVLAAMAPSSTTGYTASQIAIVGFGAVVWVLFVGLMVRVLHGFRSR